jgi:hypothetical protein
MAMFWVFVVDNRFGCISPSWAQDRRGDRPSYSIIVVAQSSNDFSEVDKNGVFFGSLGGLSS